MLLLSDFSACYNMTFHCYNAFEREDVADEVGILFSYHPHPLSFSSVRNVSTSINFVTEILTPMQYRQFRESVDKLHFNMQKLQLALLHPLPDLAHDNFGSVSDDFASVWDTPRDSLSPPSAAPNTEVEDPFVWAEDVGCTLCNNRGEHGYVDRHAFKFERGSPSAASGRLLATFDDIPTHDPRVLDTDLESYLDKMDGIKSGTALWPTTTTWPCHHARCLHCDDDDDVDDHLV